MKTSLEHLPDNKQAEILRAVEIIRAKARPSMIILFGSYARGDWVEELTEDGGHFQYQSDYDFLVVMENEGWARKVETDDKLDNELSRAVKTPVSLIAEDIQFINRRLKKAQYFYIDIKHEGILLFDNERFQLETPKELSSQERADLAKQDFEYWFTSAIEMFETFEFNLNRKKYSLAAFELHQTTERLISAILLVFTRYKPKTHDLKKLLSLVGGIESEFLKIFPKGTEHERACFTILRKAYVDARYNPNYRATEAQLLWLAERVKQLQELTEKLCQKKIASF